MLLENTIQELVELACLWEATVPKPGNVHPGAAFADTTYNDFVLSARAIGPVFARAPHLSVGQLVLQAVQATRQAVGKNTNLGIILALAPLAKAVNETDIPSILNQLTIDDAAQVYEAIRVAQPGGLGQADSQDVYDQPTVTLLEAMRLAADRDLIARQYVTGYREVLSFLLPTLIEELDKSLPDQTWRTLAWWRTTLRDCEFFVAAASRRRGVVRSPNHHRRRDAAATRSLASQSIQATFLHGLATLGDTLISRKCGAVVMHEAQARAAAVLTAGWPHRDIGQAAYEAFDAWLRADGHRRNPGTMADLMAATLYLLLRRISTG